MSETRGKTTAILVGVGVLGVIVLGLAFWKSALFQYHLSQLEEDETYLRTISPAPMGSAESPAIGRYMSRKLAHPAQDLDAERYRQSLAPSGERLLRENFSLLGDALRYDPETGVAFLGRSARSSL